ncbi:MAG TPA: TlpA disulfide reductase family protein [Terracidiphilus sp.]|nr:TlpA disulfide reductase family protein [Terracidiphilus sp.]
MARHRAHALRTPGRVILVAMACVAMAAGASHGAWAQRHVLNRAAPDFTVTDLNGNPVHLASFRGKVVLLNFWAAWCAPCLVEMPVFDTWQRKYGTRGLQVIGISMDDDAGAARKTVARLGIRYPVAMGNVNLAARYGGVLGLPLTFLIDRNGVVRARFQGETAPAKIETRINELLARPAEPGAGSGRAAMVGQPGK